MKHVTLRKQATQTTERMGVKLTEMVNLALPFLNLHLK